MAAAAPTPVFAIKGFKITGENPLGDGETARVLAPYLRADATIETLQKATAALEAALRDKGYGLHRVALPPQEVGDTVSLNIVKFSVAKVNIEGRSIYDEGNIRRSLPELREGHSPNFKRLAIQTAIANENPNKQVQVGLREADEPDKIDATITVKEARPWTFAVGLNNGGSESTGQDRFTVTGGHTNLFNLDHQFVGAYTTSIERTEDVKQLGLSYKVPLYSLGGVIGAIYTRSDVVGNFGTFTSTGAGQTLGVNYTLYLAPQGGRRSYVTFGLEDKMFDAAQISGDGGGRGPAQPARHPWAIRRAPSPMRRCGATTSTWRSIPAAAATTTSRPTRPKTRASPPCIGRPCAAASAIRRPLPRPGYGRFAASSSTAPTC